MGEGRYRDRGPETAAAMEAYQKVTVTLYDRQILHLDKISLAIREKTGQVVHRAEMIPAIVDKVIGSMNPEGPGFDKKVKELFPAL